LEHVSELCENFELKFGEFLTGTRSPPTEVERDEDVDDIPTRFFTNITVAGGSRQAKIDKGAFAIWVSAAVYREIGTEPLACGGDANAADGRALPVLGSGRIVFGLWRRVFDVPVRVMGTLPSGILIGRRFLILQGVDLNFATMSGSFTKVIRGQRAVFSGKLRIDARPEYEEAALIQDADLEDIIAAMDLTDLGEEAEVMRAVLRRNIDVFRGLGKAVGEEFYIKVPPNFDMSQLACPPHRRSENERVLEEAEVTRLMKLGVIEPSNARASTNFVYVVKKAKDAAGNPGQRTATDHRKINQFTEQDGYPKTPLDDIVNFLAVDAFSPHWACAMDTGRYRWQKRRGSLRR
jgi:hypothetical protein